MEIPFFRGGGSLRGRGPMQVELVHTPPSQAKLGPPIPVGAGMARPLVATWGGGADLPLSGRGPVSCWTSLVPAAVLPAAPPPTPAPQGLHNCAAFQVKSETPRRGQPQLPPERNALVQGDF